MGAQFQVYIGGYVVCKNALIRVGTKTSICPTHKTKISTKFCPDCGSKTEEKTSTKNSFKIDSYKLEERLDETLVCHLKATENKNIDIWTSNFTKCGYFLNHYSNDSNDCEDINTEFILDDFNNTFKVQIEKLKEAYGSENVAVKFGYVTYYL